MFNRLASSSISSVAARQLERAAGRVSPPQAGLRSSRNSSLSNSLDLRKSLDYPTRSSIRLFSSARQGSLNFSQATCPRCVGRSATNTRPTSLERQNWAGLSKGAGERWVARRWNSPTPKAQNRATSASITQEEFEQARNQAYKKRNQSLMYYTAAVFIVGIGVTYAAVPFYRAFCSATGFGGTPMTKTTAEGRFEPSRLVPTAFFGKDKENDRIRVTFNSDTSDNLPWQFTPSTKEIHVLPGETALAFFTAKNRGPKDIVGIATYNVAPDRIAPYFAKVECFCFEEQKLLAGEEVDLPVFFFIDKDMLDDPTVQDVREVVLSYTFFSARRNEKSGQLEPDTDLSQYTVGKDLPGIK